MGEKRWGGGGGGGISASSLEEGTRRVGPLLCMHTENACRTSVICNIISASTMTAMPESTPQGREGGREAACLSKRPTFLS